MIEYFIWLMSHIREQIFERFIIPGLNVSYWDFCIALLVIGLLITVLVNGVKARNGSHQKPSKKSKSHESSDKSESN